MQYEVLTKVSNECPPFTVPENTIWKPSAAGPIPATREGGVPVPAAGICSYSRGVSQPCGSRELQLAEGYPNPAGNRGVSQPCGSRELLLAEGLLVSQPCWYPNPAGSRGVSCRSVYIDIALSPFIRMKA